MKRKIINLLILLLVCLTFVSCGQTTETPNTPGGGIILDPNEGGGEKPNPDPNPGDDHITPDPEDKTEFVVKLIYNKKVYIPKETITVIWADDYSQYSQTIDSSGYAKIMLDGDFNVYLDKAPQTFSYNPNIYTASNDEPVVEIELVKIARPSRGLGTKLYSEYEISSDGVYSANITSKTKKIFYEYEPKAAGYYVIESWVNIYADNVNPKVDLYDGTVQYKNFNKTLDTGGISKKGGYTKNFRWVVKVSIAELSNVFTFAVYADSKTGSYPVTVDFRIAYEGEYYPESIISQVIFAKEANTQADEYPASKYVFKNSDHGTGSYYSGKTNGTGILDADDYKYNEETGFWHLYDSKTGTFGPILCAKITKPCAYYDESLNLIESHGNKNLTVSNGTENYKQFIEVQYASVCNSDGVCYVTMELMEFLQKFSVSQRLFFDGNGFVESTGVYAVEEDQWLFACGYYEEIE